MNFQNDLRSRSSYLFHLIVLAAGWCLFSAHRSMVPMRSARYWLWIVLVALVSVLLLRLAGYFKDQVPTLDWQGGLTLTIALVFACYVADGIYFLVTHTHFLLYPQMLVFSVALAILFSSTQWVIFMIQGGVNVPMTLAAYLLPDEEVALRAEIHALGIEDRIKVRSRKVSDAPNEIPDRHETLVISRGATHQLKNYPELLVAHLRGQRIVDIGQLLKELRGRVNLSKSDAWSFLMTSTYQSPAIRLYFDLKTFFEPLVALALIVVLSPLWMMIALIIVLVNGRPIFYRQKRLGFRGRRFSVYKFRTMDNSAEDEGPQWARREDPRVTPIGRWLRKTRIDELPQLINVLKGELSFVGPRPERPEFYNFLREQIPLFSVRLLVRPGLTGWAQVKQGYAGSVEECKTKLEYDLYYIQHMTPWLDFEVLTSTVALMIRGNHGR